jgi:hypothetical protein
MRRWGLVFATSLSLLLTGLVTAHSSGRSTRGPRSGLGRTLESHMRAKTSGVFSTSAAWRWHQCQPNHWRACVLQR